MTQEAEMVTHHGAVPGVPPSAAAMAHLRPSNWAGGTLLSSAALLTVVGVALSLQPNWLVVAAGAGGSCCHDGPVVRAAS